MSPDGIHYLLVQPTAVVGTDSLAVQGNSGDAANCVQSQKVGVHIPGLRIPLQEELAAAAAART